MIAALLGRSREKHESAAEALLSRLGENASLVVDDRLVAELGVGRKALYRIIYDMVRRERMFMLADAKDRMLLMTNAEFSRFMFRRAGKDAPAEAGRAAAAAAGLDSDIVLLESLEDSDIVLDGRREPLGDRTPAAATAAMADAETEVPELSEPAVLAKPIDLEWFSLDVAATGTDGADAELPDYRQSLPERKRDPWLSAEEVERV